MITEALLTYVREQLAAGSSREIIENSLRANGWTDPDVAQAFAGSTPTQSQVAPSTPTRPEPVSFQSAQSIEVQNPVAGPISEAKYAPVTTPAGAVLVSPKPRGNSWRIPVLIAACVLIGGGGAFAAYQYRGVLFPSQTPPLPPQDVLRQSLSTMAGLPSAAFAATSTADTTINGDIPVSGTFILALRGTFDRHAGNPRADVTLNASFSSTGATTTGSGTVSLRGIYANSDLYMNLSEFDLDLESSDPKAGLMLGLVTGLANGIADSMENKWIKAEATSTVSAATWSAIEKSWAELAAYAEGGSSISSLEDLGNEKVAEIETRHLLLTAVYDKQLADLLLELASELQSTTTPEKTAELRQQAEQWIGKEMVFDLWIGTQDNYMYKIKAAPITIDDVVTGARSTASFEIALSEHGKTFAIVPPAGAGSLQEVMRELFGGFLASASPAATSSKEQ